MVEWAKNVKMLPSKIDLKRLSKYVAIAIYIFTLSLIFLKKSPLNIWCQNGESGIDSSVFRTVAFYMSKGYMPYRDIFDHKGPFLYLLNYLGLRISYGHGIWVIELISLFLTFVLFYKISRLVCGELFSCINIFVATTPLYIYFEGGNLTEEYAMPFISVALYIFCDYFINNKISRIRLLLCGISLGAVLMLRPNMISVWCVFCIAVMIKSIKNNNIKELLYFIFLFILGCLVFVVPILFWIIINEAFHEFVYDYFIFNIMYVQHGTMGTLSNRMNSFVNFMNNAAIFIPIIIIFYRTYRKRDLFHISYCIYVALTFLFISMSGMSYGHYGMILLPMLVYPYANVFLLKETDAGMDKNLLLVVVMYLLVTIAFPAWLEGINNAANVFDSRNEKQDSEINDLIQFVKEHTTKEDRIVVYGNHNSIYVQSQRLCASKYSYITPIIAVDKVISLEYYSELQETNPRLIIIPEEYDINDSELSDMRQFLDQNNYYQVEAINGASVYMQNRILLGAWPVCYPPIKNPP